MRPVKVGRRSTVLYDDVHATLHRRYHDTERVTEPLPTRFDAHGVERFHNLRLDDVISQRPARKPPAHLRNALAVLVREPRDVATFAMLCNVQEATAWCYACKVVETWPQAVGLAKGLVYPPLCEALSEIDCRGTLKDVMRRLEDAPSLRGDVEWRCMKDRYAHLRLGRLCCSS